MGSNVRGKIMFTAKSPLPKDRHEGLVSQQEGAPQNLYSPLKGPTRGSNFAQNVGPWGGGGLCSRSLKKESAVAFFVFKKVFFITKTKNSLGSGSMCMKLRTESMSYIN
jgi:hypothetical protein